MRDLRRLAPALWLCLSCQAPAHAASWRLRARENFETGRIDRGDGRGELAYRGFLSAFDLFYEEPFRTLAGVTLHRGSLGRIGPGESVTVTALGVEVKRFPARKARWWFLRGGALGAAVDPAGPGKDAWVYGLSTGTGVELPVWKIGLAPEIGGKFLWGSGGSRLNTLYIALGVHFYVFPGDSSSPAAR